MWTAEDSFGELPFDPALRAYNADCDQRTERREESYFPRCADLVVLRVFWCLFVESGMQTASSSARNQNLSYP